MSVELDPVELGFKRPFTHEVSQVLRLYNKNADPVAFKVKTTAPKQYCVRPNSGRIEPGKDVEVQVLLQAMKEDPPMDTKCRDKFLVQSVAISADKEVANVSQIWSQIEQTAKSSIQEKKIRVVFMPADGSASAYGASKLDDSHVYNSPSPQPETPQRVTGAGVSRVPDSESRSLGDDSAYHPAGERSYISTAAENVANTIPSSDNIKQQLSEAQAQIQRLQQQVSEQVLRQRKTDAVNQDSKERITTGTTGLGVKQVSANGVPVQVAAGLCLLCFLIAYFFF